MNIPQIPNALAAEPFQHSFTEMVMNNYDGCWTLFTDGNPLGIAYGFFLHHMSEVMVFNGFAWFPWATPRSRIEMAVKFFHLMRKEIPMVGFVSPDQVKFFDVLKAHGIVRRVGTSHIMLEDEPAATYETRWEH